MHPTCSGISFTDFKLGNRDMQGIQWEHIIMIRETEQGGEREMKKLLIK